MVLEPGDILVSWGRNVGSDILLVLQRWGGAPIPPFVDFGMAVGERKTAGQVVVYAGHILGETIESRVRRRVPAHVRHKITPIDAIFAHVQEHPQLRGSGAGLAAVDLAH